MNSFVNFQIICIISCIFLSISILISVEGRSHGHHKSHHHGSKGHGRINSIEYEDYPRESHSFKREDEAVGHLRPANDEQMHGRGFTEFLGNLANKTAALASYAMEKGQNAIEFTEHAVDTLSNVVDKAGSLAAKAGDILQEAAAKINGTRLGESLASAAERSNSLAATASGAMANIGNKLKSTLDAGIDSVKQKAVKVAMPYLTSTTL